MSQGRVLAHVRAHGGGLIGAHRIGVAALLEAEEAGAVGIGSLGEGYERRARAVELHQRSARVDADARDRQAGDQNASGRLVRGRAVRAQDVMRLAVADPRRRVEAGVGEQGVVGGAPWAHIRAEADCLRMFEFAADDEMPPVIVEPVSECDGGVVVLPIAVRGLTVVDLSLEAFQFGVEDDVHDAGDGV